MRFQSFLLSALLCTSVSLVGAASESADKQTATPAAITSTNGEASNTAESCTTRTKRDADGLTSSDRRPNCCGKCSAGGKDGCWVIPTDGKPQYCQAC